MCQIWANNLLILNKPKCRIDLRPLDPRSLRLLPYASRLDLIEQSFGCTKVVVDVTLQGMEELVYGILKQFGVTDGERIMLDSSDAMSKLCMWQLVIGYNLREYEVREQFKKQLMGLGLPSAAPT